MLCAATGDESIYRTIMNRLTALEANHTLYARYVEEQTAGVREVLRRLGEDVGRLEGIVSSVVVSSVVTCCIDDGCRANHKHICISLHKLYGGLACATVIQ
jgi:hypothetical protein